MEDYLGDEECIRKLIHFNLKIVSIEMLLVALAAYLSSEQSDDGCDLKVDFSYNKLNINEQADFGSSPERLMSRREILCRAR